MPEWLTPVIDRNLNDIKNAYKNLKRKKQNSDVPFEFSKAYINYSDLNRIENNILFLSALLNVPIQSKNWTIYDIPLISDRTRILNNADSVLTKLKQLYTVGFDDEVPIKLRNYNDFNSLENILLKMYELIKDGQYFPLDFIQTTNQQYFNTGYFPGENTRIECEVLLMDNYDNLIQELFGCDNFYIRYNQRGDHSMDVSFGGNRTTNTVSLPYFRKIRIVMDRQAVSWYDENNQLISRLTLPSGTVYTSYHPLWVGCRNNNGSVYCFGEFCLYSFRIYENNSLVMDFVPAKRKSDGVSGMLNTVTNTFCPDLNNNGFLSSVFEDNYAVVAYVNSDGNLYLNTGHTHTANTRFAIDFIPSLSGVSSFVQLWGAEANIGGRWTANDWWCYTENSALYVQRGRIESQQVSADLTQRMQITAEGLTAQFTFADGTAQSVEISGASLLSGLLTMWLFKTHYDGNPPAGISQRFYSCQIYENNTLVRDFIPVRRLSDNALMLYDRVLKIAFLPHGGNFTEVT